MAQYLGHYKSASKIKPYISGRKLACVTNWPTRMLMAQVVYAFMGCPMANKGRINIIYPRALRQAVKSNVRAYDTTYQNIKNQLKSMKKSIKN